MKINKVVIGSGLLLIIIIGFFFREKGEKSLYHPSDEGVSLDLGNGTGFLDSEDESLIFSSLEAYRKAFKKEIYYSPLEMKKEEDRIAKLAEEKRLREEELSRIEAEKKRISEIKDQEQRRSLELRRLQRMERLRNDKDDSQRNDYMQRLSKYSLRAIVYSDKEKYALIDSSIYSIDDRLDIFQVYLIEENQVTLKVGEDVFFLKLPAFSEKESKKRQAE